MSLLWSLLVTRMEPQLRERSIVRGSIPETSLSDMGERHLDQSSFSSEGNVSTTAPCLGWGPTGVR